ncbi:histidinol-phosphate transaminase [Serpentinicella alkaliphila]|uniref:Histidinol-phosphate aminotransferase n=1 Tax=Serpentinicella alkaliphila TaxID=1734049 RepID=A0A4R2TJF4_9FIRM|nr:histidinol-phosphate transaminase [Serpentinicella alkaliphila]QUH25002.1 histidinol-phosphate transaminase [Serpentinicella alkaliphila]TCQ02517.1 histidinol-phosphate aminotransferase [Serpentinicella alkaliphila]
MIEGLLKESVRSLTPYKPKSYKVLAKLDANENNHVALKLNDKIIEELKNLKINEYPDSDSTVVRGMLAEDLGVSIDQIILGCGSDQIITLIINAFIDKGDKILIHTPTFDMYRITNQVAGGVTLEVPLGENFEFNCAEFIRVMKEEKPKVIFLTNPNNPTGGVIPKDDIIQVIENSTGIVAIDEAYMEFYKDSAIDLVEKYNNVVVLRTLSKAFGLAGARVGYSIASTELTEAINRVKPPYNVSSIDQLAAKVCLENKEWSKEIIEEIIDERERVKDKLNKLCNIKVYNSEANFILFNIKNAKDIYEHLINKGVLIRHFGEQGPLAGCLRVSIGTKEQNDLFLKLLEDYVLL